MKLDDNQLGEDREVLYRESVAPFQLKLRDDYDHESEKQEAARDRCFSNQVPSIADHNEDERGRQGVFQSFTAVSTATAAQKQPPP